MCEKYVGWGHFDQVLQRWLDHLAIGPNTQWHVIFSMGTVCGLRLEGSSPFTGYTEGYWEDWPMHRVQGRFDDIRADITHTWELQRDQLPGNPGVALRAAYGVLVGDGYPYPGGGGSDRQSVQLPGGLWAVQWPARNPALFNIALADSANEAITLSGDLRRYDAMFPRVLAVISPQLQLTRAT
jgi:hypothetical protein